MSIKTKYCPKCNRRTLRLIKKDAQEPGETYIAIYKCFTCSYEERKFEVAKRKVKQVGVYPEWLF